MADAYRRRQLLLRQEDGSPGGFLRFEHIGGQCTVEARLNGVRGEARLLLLQDGEEPLALGPILNGTATFALKKDGIDHYPAVAVMRADKLLLVGGEGADFIAIRRRLAKPTQAPRQAAPKPESLPVAPRAQEITRSNEQSEDRAPDSFEGVVPPEMTLAQEPVIVPEPNPTGQASDHASERSTEQVTPQHEAWVFKPYYLPGAPECVFGRLMQGGRITATLHGVAGNYAPEPPPGLLGFVWDAGYWVRVEAVPELSKAAGET